MQPLTSDATTALLRGLREKFDRSHALAFEAISSRSWASATFTGARHELTLRLEGEGAPDAAERFAKDAEAAEFRLRGHVVADISVLSCERLDGTAARVKLEVLTVEDI